MLNLNCDNKDSQEDDWERALRLARGIIASHESGEHRRLWHDTDVTLSRNLLRAVATLKVLLICMRCSIGCHREWGDDGGDPVDESCLPSPDTCTGSTICMVDTCEPAFHRDYDVTNIVVIVPQTNEHAGTDWDPDGSPPDLY